MTTLRANQISADVLTEDITITANTGQVVNIVPELNTATGTITTLNATTGNITTLNSTTGNITTLNSTTGNITTIPSTNVSTSLSVFSQPILKRATDSTLRSANDWIRVATIPSTGAGTLKIYATDGTNTTNLVIDITNNSAWNDTATFNNRIGFKPKNLTWKGTKVLAYIRVLGSDLADTNPLIIDVQAGVSATISIDVVGEIPPETNNDFTVGGFDDDTGGVANYTIMRTIRILPVGGISIFRQDTTISGLTGVNYAVFSTTVRNDLELVPTAGNTRFPSQEDCIWKIDYSLTIDISASGFIATWGDISFGASVYGRSSLLPPSAGAFSSNASWSRDIVFGDFVRIGMFGGATYNQDSSSADRYPFLIITRTYL